MPENSPATNGGTNTTNTYQVGVQGPSSSSLTYDSNGNMMSDGTNSYKYDAENRLTQITYPGTGNSTVFSYDPFGRNVEIVENGTSPSFLNPSTMQFVWIGGNWGEARDGSGNVLAQYFAMGETQLVSSTLTPYFYTKDHLGNVREMTNGSGTVELAQSFDPYGRVVQLSNSGSFYASLGFAGYYVHQRSGLNLTVARAYSASQGRFINRDPIEEAGGVNLYGYVGGNPISGTDASGLDGIYPISGKVHEGFAVELDDPTSPTRQTWYDVNGYPSNARTFTGNLIILPITRSTVPPPRTGSRPFRTDGAAAREILQRAQHLQDLLNQHPIRYTFFFPFTGPGHTSNNLSGTLLRSMGIHAHPFFKPGFLRNLPPAYVPPDWIPGGGYWPPPKEDPPKQPYCPGPNGGDYGGPPGPQTGAPGPYWIPSAPDFPRWGAA